MKKIKEITNKRGHDISFFLQELPSIDQVSMDEEEEEEEKSESGNYSNT